MTNEEYTKFLKALAGKHLSTQGYKTKLKAYDDSNEAFRSDLRDLASIVRFLRFIIDRPNDEELVSKFLVELSDNSHLVGSAVTALEIAGILNALEDAGEVVFGELRREAIPSVDYHLLSQAGYSNDEVEVLIAVAIMKSKQLSLNSESITEQINQSPDEFFEIVENLKNGDLVKSPKKRKIFNGLGKIFGGCIAGIGNSLMITGTIIAPSPATAYGAIVSAGVGVSSLLSGIGDIRGE